MAEELSFEVVADSMRQLAIAGLKSCYERLRSLPNRTVQSSVDLNDGSIRYSLGDAALMSGNAPPKFKPLPVPRRGLHLAFFRPSFYPAGREPAECKLDLLLVTEGTNKETIGLRFERGRDEADTHAYTHMQLTRDFNCGFKTDWPDFLPTSYPAVPTRCLSFGDTWLSLLVSVYGLSASPEFGLERIIGEVDQDLRTELVARLLPRSRHLFLEAR